MNNILIASSAFIAVAAASAPAAAAPTISLNEKAFSAIRGTTDYTFSFPKNAANTSHKLGTSFTEDGVTFASASNSYLGGWNDGSFGKNVSYISSGTGDTDASKYDGWNPLTVSFNGPVLGLWLGSLYCDQTVSYVFNGISGSLDVAKGTAGTFIGFDVGAPGDISVTFKARTELDVLKFQTAVPEPATWMMMILGFGAVAGTLRRRKVTTRVAFA